MVKKLTRTGNSLALVLDRPLLDATGIDADTELEISDLVEAGAECLGPLGPAPPRDDDDVAVGRLIRNRIADQP